MRKGIILAGNWIVDYVKHITRWPEQGMLTHVKSITEGTGGCAYNTIIDLAKLQTDIPLYGLGFLGDDERGENIIKNVKKYGVDTRYMKIQKNMITSFTDVMSEAGGVRTFFYYSGASSKLTIEAAINIDVPAKIYHLGYLLLLDILDEADENGEIGHVKVLRAMRERGYKTSVDVVSETGNRFKRVVTPCLPHIDYLILNEIEAGESTGFKIREENKTLNTKNLLASVHALLEGGVNELIVIHFPEGSIAMKKGDKKPVYQASCFIKKEDIVGSVGAGDAFCAGMLYGIHEQMKIKDAMKFAGACAHFNLLNATSTGGAVEINKVLEYIGSCVYEEVPSDLEEFV